MDQQNTTSASNGLGTPGSGSSSGFADISATISALDRSLADLQRGRDELATFRATVVQTMASLGDSGGETWRKSSEVSELNISGTSTNISADSSRVALPPFLPPRVQSAHHLKASPRQEGGPPSPVQPTTLHSPVAPAPPSPSFRWPAHAQDDAPNEALGNAVAAILAQVYGADAGALALSAIRAARQSSRDARADQSERESQVLDDSLNALSVGQGRSSQSGILAPHAKARSPGAVVTAVDLLRASVVDVARARDTAAGYAAGSTSSAAAVSMPAERPAIQASASVTTSSLYGRLPPHLQELLQPLPIPPHTTPPRIAQPRLSVSTVASPLRMGGQPEYNPSAQVVGVGASPLHTTVRGVRFSASASSPAAADALSPAPTQASRTPLGAAYGSRLGLSSLGIGTGGVQERGGLRAGSSGLGVTFARASRAAPYVAIDAESAEGSEEAGAMFASTVLLRRALRREKESARLANDEVAAARAAMATAAAAAAVPAAPPPSLPHEHGTEQRQQGAVPSSTPPPAQGGRESRRRRSVEETPGALSPGLLLELERLQFEAQTARQEAQAAAAARDRHAQTVADAALATREQEEGRRRAELAARTEETATLKLAVADAERRVEAQKAAAAIAQRDTYVLESALKEQRWASAIQAAQLQGVVDAVSRAASSLGESAEASSLELAHRDAELHSMHASLTEALALATTRSKANSSGSEPSLEATASKEPQIAILIDEPRAADPRNSTGLGCARASCASNADHTGQRSSAGRWPGMSGSGLTLPHSTVASQGKPVLLHSTGAGGARGSTATTTAMPAAVPDIRPMGLGAGVWSVRLGTNVPIKAVSITPTTRPVSPAVRTGASNGRRALAWGSSSAPKPQMAANAPSTGGLVHLGPSPYVQDALTAAREQMLRALERSNVHAPAAHMLRTGGAAR